MKILLISPNYFNLTQSISNELRNQGHELHLIFDRPYSRHIFFALSKKFPSLFNFFLRSYFLKKIKKKKFDLTLVITGDSLDSYVLRQIKSISNKMTLYLWDSLKNKAYIKNKLSFYDKVYSFDSQDTKKYKLNFLPLFFQKNISGNKKSLYDVSFIGTIHSSRLKILNDFVNEFSDKKKIYLYLYIKARWVKYYFLIFNKNLHPLITKNFFYQPLPASEYNLALKQSETVLDIHHPDQSGLTFRFMNALGMGKKIITTNFNIMEYDFYSPNNFYIYNRDSRALDNFIKSKINKKHLACIKKYEISNWIQTLIK